MRYLDAGGVPARGDELAVRPAVVVDVGSRSEPQLGAVLPAAVHHREVVLAGMEELLLFLFRQFGYATDQTLDLLVLVPFFRRRYFRALLALERVPEAGLDHEARVDVEDAEVAVDLEAEI